MNLFKKLILGLVDLFHVIKHEKLRWQTEHQSQELALKQAHIFAEEEIIAQLKKKSVQLEHEIALLNEKHTTELVLFKTKCQQDIRDYKQYLAALDKLKQSIQKSYTHLPEAVAFTIHHHAKQLLNAMWEEEDFTQKMRYEMQLIDFMTAVHEDAQLHLEGNSREKLPEKTLSLLEGKKN